MEDTITDPTQVIRDIILHVYEVNYMEDSYDDEDKYCGRHSRGSEVRVIPEAALEDFEVSIGESGGDEVSKLLFKCHETDILTIIKKLQDADTYLTLIGKRMLFPAVVAVHSEIVITYEDPMNERYPGEAVETFKIHQSDIQEIIDALRNYNRTEIARRA